ncbi:MAG: EAL domain-containing protein [Inhella sp.]
MTALRTPLPSPWGALPGLLDRLLLGFSAYLLPLLLGLLTLLALSQWPREFSESSPAALDLRRLEHLSSQPSPGLRALLSQQATAKAHDTRLSEQPQWLQLVVPPATPWLEFPSRHLQALRCWDAETGTLLGQADRRGQTGALEALKAGFALHLQPSQAGRELMCQAQAAGPARLQVLAWQEAALQDSVLQFHHAAGLLDGGLTLLAAFLFISALINRNTSYSVFAVWLVLNLRMAALSAGWDAQWFGHQVPLEWLYPLRQVTMALYYLSTYALFRSFFREELQRVGAGPLLQLAQWSCVPLLLASLTLPYSQFLPLMWVCTAIGVGVLVHYLARILWVTRSQVALWYAASLAITLGAGLAEVLAAAFGLRAFSGIGNSVTAALSSSLLASLSVAAQMKQAQDARRAAQGKLEQTFSALPIGLFTLNLRGQFLAANPALQQMLGSQVLEPGANDFQRHFEPGSWVRLHERLYASPQVEMELSNQGERRFLVRAALSQDRIEGSLQDVTERSRAAENLHFLAHSDTLTRVLNRRGIEARLDEALKALLPGDTLCLAYLDLDRFKLINDLYGHSAGDAVLQQVCARVQGVLVEPMQFGRVGGDEFLIVMAGIRTPLARLIAQGVVGCIGNSPYRIDERAFHVRGSVGLVEVPSGTSIKDAIARADRACREAKGKPQSEGLVVFERDSPAQQEHEAEMRLVALLSAGEEIQGLHLAMQPIMSLLQPRGSLNFEVLLRMHDGAGRPVPTHRLIAAAELSGRMSVIDRWVLQQTLLWIIHHREELPQLKFVCMNLSGASLNDEHFVEDVFDMLETHIEAAPYLCLEITESVALHDLANTRRFISQVRQIGAKVALDDFGAGYTSFSYLKELPGDLLKIDGSFIVSMNQHPANIAIVEAIVSLARNLGMKTVAEWAEDAETVETLAEIGVDYVQGFAVARPQSPQDLLKLRSAADLIDDQALHAFIQRVETGGAVTGMFVGSSPGLLRQ